MTPEVLRALLHYDPDTGLFVWRSRPETMFWDTERWTADQCCRRWNTKYAGTPALAARKAAESQLSYQRNYGGQK